MLNRNRIIFRRSLQVDRRKIIENTGESIQGHINKNNSQEDWTIIKRWYMKSTGKHINPITEDQIDISKKT